MKILQSKLAKQQKVLEGCAPVVLQKCWALQIPSEKNQRKILISGTLCAMPHQQYLSKILPRNWLKNKNKNKKPQLKVISYRKSYVSPLRWFTGLCTKIWMPARTFCCTEVCWLAKENIFTCGKRPVFYFWKLEKRHTAVNVLKSSLSAKPIFDNCIRKFECKLSLIKTKTFRARIKPWILGIISKIVFLYLFFF